MSPVGREWDAEVMGTGKLINAGVFWQLEARQPLGMFFSPSMMRRTIWSLKKTMVMINLADELETLRNFPVVQTRPASPISSTSTLECSREDLADRNWDKVNEALARLGP